MDRVGETLAVLRIQHGFQVVEAAVVTLPIECVEELIGGIGGVAAPFFSPDDAVLGAVGVWSPAARARQSLDVLAGRLLAAAREASALFGQMD